MNINVFIGIQHVRANSCIVFAMVVQGMYSLSLVRLCREELGTDLLISKQLTFWQLHDQTFMPLYAILLCAGGDCPGAEAPSSHRIVAAPQLHFNVQFLKCRLLHETSCKLLNSSCANQAMTKAVIGTVLKIASHCFISCSSWF